MSHGALVDESGRFIRCACRMFGTHRSRNEWSETPRLQGTKRERTLHEKRGRMVPSFVSVDSFVDESRLCRGVGTRPQPSRTSHHCHRHRHPGKQTRRKERSSKRTRAVRCSVMRPSQSWMRLLDVRLWPVCLVHDHSLLDVSVFVPTHASLRTRNSR